MTQLKKRQNDDFINCFSALLSDYPQLGGHRRRRLRVGRVRTVADAEDVGVPKHNYHHHHHLTIGRFYKSKLNENELLRLFSPF